MLSLVATFFAGALFALGLVLGGMTEPRKVIGFLDVGGAWDASLVCVMGGAVVTYALGYFLVGRGALPHFSELKLPTRRDFDVPLVLGAILFGAGWGLGGFCPGPGIVASATLAPEALTFTSAMLLGMALFRGVSVLRARAAGTDRAALPVTGGSSP
jgi:uncharacterized membrane protein YedE/YeeE